MSLLIRAQLTPTRRSCGSQRSIRHVRCSAQQPLSSAVPAQPRRAALLAGFSLMIGSLGSTPGVALAASADALAAESAPRDSRLDLWLAKNAQTTFVELETEEEDVASRDPAILGVLVAVQSVGLVGSIAGGQLANKRRGHPPALPCFRKRAGYVFFPLDIWGQLLTRRCVRARAGERS